MKPRTILVSMSLLTALSACEARNLYVAHDTVVGVNAQLSADRQQGRLVVGYDRDFVTIIPKTVSNQDGSQKDAMALLGCTKLRVSGIFLSSYSDTLASGEAAKIFAKNLSKDPRFFDCHEPREEKKK